MELAGAFLIANTPASLYESLLGTAVVTRMRDEATPNQLRGYYDFLTARAKRTEIVIALAYATLLSMAIRADTSDIQPDASRLTWGEVIAQTARLKNPPISGTIINLSSPVRVDSRATPNSSLVLLA